MWGRQRVCLCCGWGVRSARRLRKSQAPRTPPRKAQTRVVGLATPTLTHTHTHELSHMDLLDLLDDHVLLYLLGRGGLACFARAWQLNHRTKRLCSIEIQALLPAMKALASPPFEISLAQSFGISGETEFNRACAGITPQDMVVFSSAVSRGALASLKKLYLHYNQIGHEGMKAFSSALSSGSLASLEELNLAANKIGDEGMKAFSSAISSGSLGSLETLLLGGNQIGDEGIKAFSTALSSGSLARLKHLDLRLNIICNEGMIAFSEALKPNSNYPMGARATLEELWLGCNRIGDEGWKALSTALSSGALTSLRLLSTYKETPQLRDACDARGIILEQIISLLADFS